MWIKNKIKNNNKTNFTISSFHCTLINFFCALNISYYTIENQLHVILICFYLSTVLLSIILWIAMHYNELQGAKYHLWLDLPAFKIYPSSYLSNVYYTHTQTRMFNDIVFLYLLKAGCCSSKCAFREWRLVGDKLQLFCFKDYDALIATRPAVYTVITF